jgi:hypothetical protein
MVSSKDMRIEDLLSLTIVTVLSQDLTRKLHQLFKSRIFGIHRAINRA